jgi:hypothetical protein
MKRAGQPAELPTRPLCLLRCRRESSVSREGVPRLISPRLETGLGAFRQEHLPSGFKIGAGVLEGCGGAGTVPSMLDLGLERNTKLTKGVVEIVG